MKPQIEYPNPKNTKTEMTVRAFVQDAVNAMDGRDDFDSVPRYINHELKQTTIQRRVLHDYYRAHQMGEKVTVLRLGGSPPTNIVATIIMNDMAKKTQQTPKPAAVPAAAVSMLPISAIAESPNNPRTQFDQSAIDELAESIAQVGLIQPIIVRSDADGYEIVCGARRFRAAQKAQLEDIPAIVRELSDDEAFELAITENLQRKDVHPLDEAIAIKKLKDKGNKTTEIAARLGKSEKYVLERLKLNDLIAPLQALLYRGKMLVSHAQKFARVSTSGQQFIFEECYSDAEGEDFDPRGINLDYVLRQSQARLNDAIFDTTDPNLVPAVGPCTTCQYNSACSNLLFPEYEKEPRCTNRECYDKKTEAHQLKIVDAIDGETTFAINDYYGYDGGSNPLKTEVQNRGLKILSREKQFRKLIEPEKPDEPDKDEYKSGEDGYYTSQEAADEAYKSDMEEYEQDLAEYNSRLAEYKEAMASGKFVYGVDVTNNIGKKIPIIILDDSSSTTETADNSNELSTLEAKHKRAAEIDQEKIHERLFQLYSEGAIFDPSIKNEDGQTTVAEDVVLVMILWGEVDWSDRREFKHMFDLESDASDEDIWDAIKDRDDLHSTGIIPRLIHLVAKNKYAKFYTKTVGRSVLRSLVDVSLDENVINEVEAEFAEKAQKREARYQERIQELKSKQQ